MRKMGMTKKPLFVISTERSEWRDLYNTLIINRYLDYALRAALDMTAFLVIPEVGTGIPVSCFLLKSWWLLCFQLLEPCWDGAEAGLELLFVEGFREYGCSVGDVAFAAGE